MKISIKKEDERELLVVNDGNPMNISEVTGDVLEDFFEAALAGESILQISDNLDAHPIAMLFRELEEIGNPENEVNQKIKEIEQDTADMKKKLDEFTEES